MEVETNDVVRSGLRDRDAMSDVAPEPRRPPLLPQLPGAPSSWLLLSVRAGGSPPLDDRRLRAPSVRSRSERSISRRRSAGLRPTRDRRS